MQLQPKYKIYPTLLDSFIYYQSSESDQAEQDLINKINRVPFFSEAAEKGTRFNKVIDCVLDGNNIDTSEFDSKLIEEISEILADSILQVYTSCQINTGKGIVLMYGYIDYVKEDRVIDLKTTSKYDLGKYYDSIQRHFYPVSLTMAGNEINTFEFLVTDFENVYSEVYKFDYAESLNILENTLENFIDFLEAKRDLITDKKIFIQ